MGKQITNDFSWSKSRHEKFSECLKAYYYQYYQSWGGWASDAPSNVRELYTLKRLGNRFTWAGSVVHEAIRDSLTAIRWGRAVDAQATLEKWHKTMRQDFTFSKSRGYWHGKTRKEFSGLVEHEYEEPVTAEEWKAIWDNTHQALTWFFESRWLSVARSLKPNQWLEVDFMDFEKSIFFLEGVKVFAVPDFAFLDDAGRVVIVDWKTGKAREGYDDQILGYALYLSHRYQLPLSGMQAQLVYLNEGAEKSVAVETEALDGFMRKFIDSTTQMKSLLADASKNVPMDETWFKRTEDVSACARCPFRRPCGRQALGAQKAQ